MDSPRGDEPTAQEYARGKQDMNKSYDNDDSFGVDLPPELWIDILARAGPGAAARASQASRALHAYGHTAVHDIGVATKRGICRTPLSCTRALVCAIVRDDPDDLAAILLSGVVDPQLPAVPTYMSPGDAELTRLLMSEGACTAVKNLTGDPVYFFEVPSMALPGGWTPLNMAVAFRSPRSVAVLKSFGARPTTTIEPLLAEVMQSVDSPFTMVSQREDGMLVPLPPRNVLRVAMVDRLLSEFGRTSPLANTDTNPLTAVREDYVLHESIRNAIPGARADEPVRFLPRAIDVTPHLRLAPLPDNLANRDQMRVMTDELAAQWAETHSRSWPVIIDVLIEAGYSPDERTYIFPRPGDARADTRNMTERAAAAKYLDGWARAADEKLNAYNAISDASPNALSLATEVRAMLVGVAVLRYIVGTYNAV